MTATLTDFLLARIAEDEAEAVGLPDPDRRMFPTARFRDQEGRVPSVALGFPCPTCHAEIDATCLSMQPPGHPNAPKPARALHGTRKDLARATIRRKAEYHWGTTRVLAECEAKRRIFAMHHDAERQWDWACDGDIEEGRAFSQWPCETVRILAAIYSDHPDYRSDWSA